MAMLRTTWLALFGLIGLGAVMAIRLAAPAPVVATAQDQRRATPVFALDEAAKSDRLELTDTRSEAEIVVPSTRTMPTATASIRPVTISKTAEPHWQNANAMIGPAPLPHPHHKTRPSTKIVVKSPPIKRAEAWHCRQDAMGTVLRSLNLSPRCDL